MVAADQFVLPSPVGAEVDPMQGIAAGGSATLRTDACPSDLDKRKLGDLACNQNYQVFYDARTLRWGAIGPAATLLASGAEQNKIASLNPGPPPSERMIIIWGLGFHVNDELQALTGDGTVVGHLTHTPAG